MTGNMLQDHVSGTLSLLDQEVIRHVPPGGNWRDLPDDFPSARVQQIRASAARGEGSRSTYYGRLVWDRPSYTISTYFTRPGNGSFIHPELPRLLTVREAARLQGFPDNIRFHGSLRQRCMQVGNAVPPLLAYRLGRSLRAGTAVDLFAGAGGVGLGLGWAGHRIVASVDNNPDACRTLRASHTPDLLVLERDLGDPEQLDDTLLQIKKRLNGAPLGLLAGGPPCQGFSTAGPCRVEDPRNQLVLSFLRAIEKLEPAQVLFENVVALRWRGQPFLDELMERMETLGYEVDVRILHAEAYGVPQLRRRLVVLASREGGVRWPQPTHEMIPPWFPADQPGVRLESPSPHSVRDAISDLAVPPSAALDTPVRGLAPTSPYSRWASGGLDIDTLLFGPGRGGSQNSLDAVSEVVDPQKPSVSDRTDS
jgi:DNA (cytosine-5)-methyltransferase 1